MTTPDTPPPDHGREGSDAACRVLVTLHWQPMGLSLQQIAVLTQLPEPTVRQAIVGLSERRRIKCIARGPLARWFTMPHYAAAVAAK